MRQQLLDEEKKKKGRNSESDAANCLSVLST